MRNRWRMFLAGGLLILAAAACAGQQLNQYTPTPFDKQTGNQGGGGGY